MTPPAKKAPKWGAPRKTSWRTAVRLLPALFAIAAVLAGAWYWNRPQAVLDRWQERLAGLADDQIKAEIQRIRSIGDSGIPILAVAMGIPRESVAYAARQALLDDIDRWETLDPHAAAAQFSSLAAALAGQAPQFDKSTRCFAADLALRILRWNRASDDPGQSAIAGQCEAVLAAARMPRGADELARRSPAELSAERLLSSPANPAGRESLPASSSLPGGGLPVEMAEVRPAPVQPPRTKADEPNLLPPEAIADSKIDEADAASLHDRATAANEPRRLASTNDAPKPDHALNAGAADGRYERNAQASFASIVSHDLRLRELMRKLSATDPQIASAARSELDRRGVSGPLLELARRATDANVAIRRQFAESLPQQNGLDARPWLLELSYDDDPTVRATAVTLMATSGDVELLKRVQQVALEDPDDHTRAQAEKALPKQKNR